MRSENEVRAAFDELVKQRDSATTNSAAHDMTNQRIIALAWVLQHPKVAQATLCKAAFDLFDSVG